MYAVIAMGGVFAGATQAPLTAIASVLEMTGNFTLTLPVMLACGIAAATSKQLTYGSIYTTKLLRRRIDIEQPKATSALATLNVAEVMQPVAERDEPTRLLAPEGLDASSTAVSRELLARLVGPVSDARDPQVLFGDEDLAQALRQLVLYGHDGLPVLSHDEHTLQGWVTREDVMSALVGRARASARDIERGAEAAEFAVNEPHKQVHVPTMPLNGYEILEITISPQATACGRRLGELRWPTGSSVLAASEGHKLIAPGADIELRPGERIVLLTPGSGLNKRAIPRYRQSDLFTEREKLALDYTVAVMRTPVEVTDELFAQIKEHFTDEQLVEITAHLMVVNLDRFNAAFRIGSAGFSQGMVCVLPDRPTANPVLARIA